MVGLVELRRSYIPSVAVGKLLYGVLIGCDALFVLIVRCRQSLAKV